MAADTTKEQLIEATLALLEEEGNSSSLTARKIAARAGANLAMINYHFGSRDALINLAVQRIIALHAKNLSSTPPHTASPRDKLTLFLTQMSDITLNYSELTKASIPYVLLQGEMDHPYYILPYITEYFGGMRSEGECRIIAYQLVSFFQLVFYRSEDFRRYSGLDINDKTQRDELIKLYWGCFCRLTQKEVKNLENLRNYFYRRHRHKSHLRSVDEMGLGPEGRKLPWDAVFRHTSALSCNHYPLHA